MYSTKWPPLTSEGEQRCARLSLFMWWTHSVDINLPQIPGYGVTHEQMDESKFTRTHTDTHHYIIHNSPVSINSPLSFYPLQMEYADNQHNKMESLADL